MVLKYLDHLDPEELVGKCWHRVAGEGADSYPGHPDAAVTLDEVRDSLGVYFRGLGGDPGIQLAPVGERRSDHRLTLRQRLGRREERLHRPEMNEENLLLPDEVALFPDPGLNRDLYRWLATYFAHQDPSTCEPRPDDPLRRDLALLRRAHRTTENVLNDLPGLERVHDRLAAATLDLRDRDPGGQESAVERVVEAVLAREPPSEPDAREVWRAVDGDAQFDAFEADDDYRPFLPVPLWGEVTHRGTTDHDSEERGDAGAAGAPDLTDEKRSARREEQDEANREDSLIANNFDKVLALAEMINLNRVTDDADEEEAKRAADDVDEIVLSPSDETVASEVDMDLDLPPGEVDTRPLDEELTYPEWDYRRDGYHEDHCAVTCSTASAEGTDWTPDDDTRRRIRKVRKRFEALLLRRQKKRRQVDGDRLDVDAAVRAICDLEGSGECSDRLYVQSRRDDRDLSVAILVDVSLSTDAWVDDRRVLDVEREALATLSHGLDACGDEHAIFTFTSRKRTDVTVDVVKDFDEPLSRRVMRRVSAITPGHYTRMGAAVRHAASELEDRPRRDRLILLLTDGKPNDMDHYEGRYGVEDTRRAVQEARRDGVEVFGVTIDDEAREYFPHIFGRGGYQIVPDPDRLPDALPKIYRRLVD